MARPPTLWHLFTRTMTRAARIDLHVHFRSQGIRWPLRSSDIVEVWDGDEQVGAVSGETIRRLLEHHLATAALQAVVATEMNTRLDLLMGRLDALQTMRARGVTQSAALTGVVRRRGQPPSVAERIGLRAARRARRS